MERLKSIEELQALRERMVADRKPNLPVIVITAGTCGQASGANDLIRIAKREILAHGLADTRDCLHKRQKYWMNRYHRSCSLLRQRQHRLS